MKLLVLDPVRMLERFNNTLSQTMHLGIDLLMILFSSRYSLYYRNGKGLALDSFGDK